MYENRYCKVGRKTTHLNFISLREDNRHQTLIFLEVSRFRIWIIEFYAELLFVNISISDKKLLAAFYWLDCSKINGFTVLK